MVQLRLRACDGCGTVAVDADVQKVVITIGGHRMTVDVCKDCRVPVEKLLDNHQKNKKTGRRSGLVKNDVLEDVTAIVKDNPRPPRPPRK